MGEVHLRGAMGGRLSVASKQSPQGFRSWSISKQGGHAASIASRMRLFRPTGFR